MMLYHVEFGPEDGPVVLSESVEALDQMDAMHKVLEPFKNDPRAIDIESWLVKIKVAEDANRS